MATQHFTQCKVCSKEFKEIKGKSNKFCSLDCYRISQRSGDYKRGHKATTFKTSCGFCGLLVYSKQYCNRDCYDKARAKAILDRRVECKVCKTLCQPSYEYPNSFCSVECLASHKKAKPKNCVNCKCLFTPVKLNAGANRMISHNSGKTCSAKCQIEWIKNNPKRKEKISLKFRGALHPNWQGGSHVMASRGHGWARLRDSIKSRDGYKCLHCGMTDAECKEKYKCSLNVNHIRPFHQFGGNTKLANKPSNLESLCKSCHTKADAKWRRENAVQYSLGAMFR
jgi:hypothetical protein